MIRRSILAAAAFLAAMNLTDAAFAGANDYVFEPVKAEVRKGDDVVVSVRLKNKASGKPVTDANVLEQINSGGNGMPPYADMLSADDKANVMAYLHTI